MPRPCEVSTPRTGGGAVALSRWHLEGCGISLRSQRRLLSSRWAMGMETESFGFTDAIYAFQHQSDRHVRCCEIILSLNWPIQKFQLLIPKKNQHFTIIHSPKKWWFSPWFLGIKSPSYGSRPWWLRQLLPSQGSSGGGSGRSGRLGATPGHRWRKEPRCSLPRRWWWLLGGVAICQHQINQPPPPHKVSRYLARSFLVFPVNKRPLGRGWLIRGTLWLLLMGHMGSWGVPFGSYQNCWFL